MASQSVYQPLDIDKQSIRLLRIHKNTRGQQPSCSIFESTVDGYAYIALSYMWHPEGNEHPAKCCPILLDGEEFEVSQNLWAFLDIAQELYADKALWIDAICIDQSNIKERNHQVTIMDRIYSCASSVLVWLGPGTNETDCFFDFVSTGKWDQCFPGKRKRRLVLLDSESRWDLRMLSGRDADDFLEVESHRRQTESLEKYRWRTGFLETIRNPYWSRIWIVQEILQAANISIMTGIRILDWDALFVPMSYQDYSGSQPAYLEFKLGAHHMNRVQYARDSPEAQARRTRRPKSLYDYIICFSIQDCSDPRDRIYAMLGLAERRNNFPVDYDVDMRILIERTLLFEKFANILLAVQLLKTLGLSPTLALNSLSDEFLSSEIPLEHEVPFCEVKVCEDDDLKETRTFPSSYEMGVKMCEDDYLKRTATFCSSRAWAPYLRAHHGEIRPCGCGKCYSNGANCVPEQGDLVAQLPNCDGLLILCKPIGKSTGSFRCAAFVDVPLFPVIDFKRIDFDRVDFNHVDYNNRWHLDGDPGLYCFLPSKDVGDLDSITITQRKARNIQEDDELAISLNWRTLFGIIAQHAQQGRASGPELQPGSGPCKYNRWDHDAAEHPFSLKRYPRQYRVPDRRRLDDNRQQRSSSGKADLERHTRSVHRKSMYIDCPHRKCDRRGTNGFTRNDHLMEHRRLYHGDNLTNPKKQAGWGLRRPPDPPTKSSRNTLSIRQKR
jgi:hypothetical protein